MRVEVTMPEEYMGDVIGGDISTLVVDVSKVWMTSAVERSLEDMFRFQKCLDTLQTLRSRTQGRGNYSMFFEKYEPVPKSVQEKILSNKNA